MFEVAIIGAGELGGALAHTLAMRDTATSIRLIDERGSIAAGKALDIAQAAPLQGFAARVDGHADLVYAAGADVLVIADWAGRSDNAGGDRSGDEGLLLLTRLRRLARDRVVLCAGAEARELVEWGVRELKIPRETLFGSAPEALASALRAMVALETRGSPQDVSLAVLGAPPSHVVVPWDEATIGGFAATSLLDEPARRRLAARVAPLWPPGPYALAQAAVQAIDAIANRSRRLVSCFVAPDDSQGVRARAVAMAARLGPGGIVSLLEPRLNGHDRVAMDNATLL